MTRLCGVRVCLVETCLRIVHVYGAYKKRFFASLKGESLYTELIVKINH